MMLTDSQIKIRKEFRAFLVAREGIKGRMLNFVISATDSHIQIILKKWYSIELSYIYDNALTIEDLVEYSDEINSNDEVLASSYGYISGKALELYSHY